MSIPQQIVLIFSMIACSNAGLAQTNEKVFHDLIAKYAEAREKQDADLLKSVLTEDVDQLVSSGEWRIGLDTAVEGMKRSSQINEGKRVLTVEKVKILSPVSAVVDARYQIISPQDEVRNMWSTFIVVLQIDAWKIAGIRNMLPTNP